MERSAEVAGIRSTGDRIRSLRQVYPAQLAGLVFPDLRGIAVLIPAWQPDERLSTLIEELLPAGFAAIILVDDGSRLETAPIFLQARKLPGVVVLRHATNLGKGRALKTGLNYALTELAHVRGVVTADADGQHRVADIVRLGEALATSRGTAVLGVRLFTRDVPLRSRFGNTLTRYVFWLLAGSRVSDTQSGLRGFPVAMIPPILALEGERYEYEMNVLAHLCREGDPPIELPIATIYIEENRSSHFDPVRDSMRIYFVLLRFYSSSLVATAVDFAVFGIMFAGTHNLLLSMIVGRLSSIANYLLNRSFVFRSKTSVGRSLVRYYLLVLLLAGTSYGIVRSLTAQFGWHVLPAKVMVETILSLASFVLQQAIVFPARKGRMPR